jgi:hypothetical protein
MLSLTALCYTQALPSVLSAATRLAYLDISENDCLISPDELHWLSANLRRNSHLRPSGLQVGCKLA